MPTELVKKKWGGKRAGQGRKPLNLPAHFIEVRMSAEDFAMLMAALPKNTVERGRVLMMMFRQTENK